MQLKTTIGSLLLTGLIAIQASCSSEPVTVNIGEEFQIDGNALKVEAIEARKFLVNDEKRAMEVAPAGKHYLYVKLYNPNDEMVFLKAMDGDKPLKREDSVSIITNHLESSSSSYEDAYFLVDDGKKITFSLKTPRDDFYHVADVSYPNKDDRQVAPKMKELMAKYDDWTNFLEPLKGYVNGKNIYDVVKEKGADVAVSPKVKGMTIDYFSPDASFYEVSSSFLGATMRSKIQWEGDVIASVEFALP